MAAAINMSWAHRIGENNNNKRTRGLLHSSGVFTVHAHIYCVAFVKLPHITCILCGKTSKRATPEFKLYRKLLQHVVYRISRDDDNRFLYRLPTLKVDPRECSIHALLKNNIYAIYIGTKNKTKNFIHFFLSRSFPKSSPLRSFFYLPILVYERRAYRRADYYCTQVHTQMPPETVFHICACLSPLLPADIHKPP